MSERLTRDDVIKVAHLARIALSDDEVERASDELSGMLEHFADIDALDLDDVEPMTQPYPLVNVMRSDEVRPGIDRDDALSQAPRSEDGRFRVPPTGGEP